MWSMIHIPFFFFSFFFSFFSPRFFTTKVRRTMSALQSSRTRGLFSAMETWQRYVNSLSEVEVRRESERARVVKEEMKRAEREMKFETERVKVESEYRQRIARRYVFFLFQSNVLSLSFTPPSPPQQKNKQMTYLLHNYLVPQLPFRGIRENLIKHLYFIFLPTVLLY